MHELNTENSIKYKFSDFTENEYEKLLLKARATRTFTPYTNYTGNINEVYWRHDIDVSVEDALRLAKVEHQFEIKSLFLFLLHSEYYNLLDIIQVQRVKEIIQMGHEIGLHFDAQFYNISSQDQLADKIIKEANFLENVFNTPINVFSFHNTTDFTMSCKEERYGGLINTYSSFFQEHCGYASDSNGYWRFKSIGDTLDEPVDKPLQILTHAEWWTKEIMSPKQKVDRCIDLACIEKKQFYYNTLSQFNRENIDW